MKKLISAGMIAGALIGSACDGSSSFPMPGALYACTAQAKPDPNVGNWEQWVKVVKVGPEGWVYGLPTGVPSAVAPLWVNLDQYAYCHELED
jgi:hypothetical protein